ncbi:MAG: MGMT family protein [Phycisphaeraceae bacterium]|nr:MGMT family protein [Phycisphaeraceae bacterium]
MVSGSWWKVMRRRTMFYQKPVSGDDKMNDCFEQDIRAGRLRRGMSFDQQVWAVTARIPRGQVATYGDVAAALHSRAFRAVGAALGRNPYAPIVPCHRVIGSNGRLTGFAGGLPQKARLLRSEGISVQDGRVDMRHCRYRPSSKRGG